MHPIYDASPYPFHLKEARELHAALGIKYNQSQMIEYQYRSCGEGLPVLHLGVYTVPQLWKEALDNLAATALTKTLCDLIRNSNPGPNLVAALDAVHKLEPSTQKRLIGERGQKIMDYMLVLDRKDFRACLDYLADDNSRVKMIVVGGEPDSGKSHTRHLFEELAKEKGWISMYLYSPMINSVAELLDTLFIELGGGENIPLVEKYTSKIGWYKAVCNQMARLASDKQKQLWIAMDDLGLDENGISIIDEEVRNFFVQFGLLMGNPAFRKSFRLLLINMPKPIPVMWQAEHWRDVFAATNDIQEDHIVELIKDWCKVEDKGLLETEMRAKAADIVARANAIQQGNGNSRLKFINTEVVSYLTSLA